jgi:plasmid maintenance system antidote protein VapI
MNKILNHQLNNKREVPFIHPGIILNKEMLKRKRISQKKLASATNIPYEVVKDICRGKKDIDKNVGRELSSYFQVNKDF